MSCKTLKIYVPISCENPDVAKQLAVFISGCRYRYMRRKIQQINIKLQEFY